MVKLKTAEDITRLTEGGAMLASILDELEKMVAPGVTGQQLEQKAQDMMVEYGVTGSFLGYASGGRTPYPAVTCISLNEAVVHGLPTDMPFQEGDIVGIDAGLIYQNKYYLDHARTIPVGAVSENIQSLLDVTKTALQKGIEAAMAGNTTGDIGHAVQAYIESEAKAQGKDFGIVRELVGHGVGFDVHEDPQVPNVGKPGKGHKLEEGLVIAIEPMITLGSPALTTAPDGWTVITRSGSPAAHFEHTIAITSEGPKIITTSK